MKKYLIYTLFLILLAVIVYLGFFREPKIEFVSYPVYRTDTIYVYETIKVPKPYPVPTPPSTVEIYLVDSLAIDSLKLELSKQNIILQGLYSQIEISQNFLKQFPYNPKLLGLELSFDSLSLSILKTNGIPESQTFPIFLSGFKYRWTNEGLSSIPIDPRPINLPLQSYLGLGVDLLHLSPYVNVGVEKDYTRIKLYGDIRVGLLKTEYSGIDLGIKYKFRFNGVNKN
jgi:hypothetical protein